MTFPSIYHLVATGIAQRVFLNTQHLTDRSKGAIGESITAANLLMAAGERGIILGLVGLLGGLLSIPGLLS